MSELRADIWPEEPAASHASNTPRRLNRPPVTSIRTWLECYGRKAAVLTSRFPEKAAELWAYQTIIIHAAHTYEGANWVAYDRLYRREKLAARDLNWSVPNQRLYSEAFTGRARRHPQCPYCLWEDHGGWAVPTTPTHQLSAGFKASPNSSSGRVSRAPHRCYRSRRRSTRSAGTSTATAAALPGAGTGMFAASVLARMQSSIARIVSHRCRPAEGPPHAAGAIHPRSPAQAAANSPIQADSNPLQQRTGHAAATTFTLFSQIQPQTEQAAFAHTI